MDSQKSEWWYARVGASPQPEAGELVNIGLILGNGGPSEVEVAQNLPRLSGLVTPTESRIYKELIDAISEDVKEGANLQSLRQTFGPQIKISEPRPLYDDPDSVRVKLRQKFLETPREDRRSEAGPREEAEEKVEQIISRHAQLGYEVKRHPTPSRLYGEQWRKVFPRGTVHRLAFALRSKVENSDVLVDGIVIDEDDPWYPVTHGQVSRIDHTFWEYRRAEDMIKQMFDRRVRRVGFIFNGDVNGNQHSGMGDVVEYIHHAWREDTHFSLEASNEEHLERFRNALRSTEWDG